VILLGLTGVPMMVAGYWVLKIWVGDAYAVQTIGFLRILILANIIRNICLPYATFLAATGRQKVAVAGATAEAIVNLGSSLFLVQRLGAIGVAYGTLLGAGVSFGMHFAVSMHYTYAEFSVTRARLLWSGVLRPLTVAIPSALILPLWWLASAPSMSPVIWIVWLLSTLAICWFVGLSSDERGSLTRVAAARMNLMVR
jgi:O-antigen/teichoic acid export membrane protein